MDYGPLLVDYGPLGVNLCLWESILGFGYQFGIQDVKTGHLVDDFGSLRVDFGTWKFI